MAKIKVELEMEFRVTRSKIIEMEADAFRSHCRDLDAGGKAAKQAKSHLSEKLHHINDWQDEEIMSCNLNEAD